MSQFVVPSSRTQAEIDMNCDGVGPPASLEGQGGVENAQVMVELLCQINITTLIRPYRTDSLSER